MTDIFTSISVVLLRMKTFLYAEILSYATYLNMHEFDIT